MVDRKWETDEDEMIHHLQVHRNFIGWVIDKLRVEGIPCDRTRGNDRKIVDKGCVSAVLITGRITEPAKKLFDDYDIAYAENIPEKELMELEENKEV